MPNEKLDGVDAAESRRILTSRNAALVLIDYQAQTIFTLRSHDPQLVINNAVAVAKTAKAFSLPVVLSTVSASTFTGALVQEIQDVFPDVVPIDRTSLNAWYDEPFRRAIKATGRRKVILGGLYTELCATLPTLSAIEAGYEVYVVADICGSSSEEGHRLGLERMIQAGATPVTWIALASELQYDWARQDTYQDVVNVFTEHSGGFGQGIRYHRQLVAPHL